MSAPVKTPSHRTAAQVRQEFMDFFVQRAGHTFVPSSPVVPHDDPTLLFANAGMNQFKPLFLGQVRPGSPLAGLKRAVNSQKCIRAGGKHNDLDDVGKDGYHHTFFEMLGNWSFGDYFKTESIQWGWELLTQVWGLDPSRMYATYFEGNKAAGLEPDREAYELWRKLLPADHVLPGNMKDNFWEMGDTGPCGPCSEIHYDCRSVAERQASPGAALVNAGDPNVIEFWNHVFIQFNRDASGKLSLLPAKHVDTGMGLERVVRIIQGKTSNYDTDAFTPLFDAIRRICHAPPYAGTWTDPKDTAYRVIADHVRTLTFAITDGAEPSNEGRGYVLRRILRRAVRYGRQTLNVPGVFMAELVPTVVETMGAFFPELRKNPEHVIRVIRDEEEAFGRTLATGLALFDKAAEGKQQIAAPDAFKLHDTYGFPIDLTQLMAEERGMSVDVAGFNKLMEEARELSRTGGKAEDGSAKLLLGTSEVARLKTLHVKPTDDSDKFHGRNTRARVLAIWNGHDFDDSINAANTRPADRFAVILDKTCFYAEMGGQVADTGHIARVLGGSTDFVVESARNCAGYIVHIGALKKGELKVGMDIETRLDAPRRAAIASNHTSTHILNHALRAVLGERVDQKGSLVAPERLRFDFSHSAAMNEQEVAAVQAHVRDAIERDLPVYTEIVPLEQAKKIHGVRAVFGETYPDPVRVVSVGVSIGQLLSSPDNARWQDYSIEFCGGTHLTRSAEAGAFAVISEEAVSKGVRRITAVTGEAAKAAEALAEGLSARLRGAGELDARHLSSAVTELAAEIDRADVPLVRKAEMRKILGALQEEVKKHAKAAAGAGREKAVALARELAEKASGAVIVEMIQTGSDRDALMAALDAVKARRSDSAVMLISPDEGEKKVTIVAAVPPALVAKGLKAGDWVREASAAVGGKGGGRPDAAQGGGTDPGKAQQAVDTARQFATSRTS